MKQLFQEKLLEVIKGVLPLITVICILQFTLVKAPIMLFLQFLLGCLMVVLGLMMFFAGIDIGILPMGKFIGAELPMKGSLMLIIAVTFSLGFVTTVAEPDVLVLSKQVDVMSRGVITGNTVLYTTALGVGFFVAIAIVRIIFGFSMVYLLAAAYSAVILLSFITPVELIPLAFDSGSVTTGALTAPVVLAVALGLSSVLAGRSTVSDGFGILGLPL